MGMFTKGILLRAGEKVRELTKEPMETNMRDISRTIISMEEEPILGLRETNLWANSWMERWEMGKWITGLE